MLNFAKTEGDLTKKIYRKKVSLKKGDQCHKILLKLNEEVGLFL